ncbi:hypothetical protein [Clostridium beijerinckii]|uniref:Uncharacterized protein n=1 Tax=Clostridium beijerinckii TaxID=1520 RepID=A0AAX0B0Q8_CLOBE|nr:hypothetical protein [Clostridium beijerinckii]NRT88905.1 hypothetical protein [Clostridium beijerinckii]NYC74360.1 hypothetical protein [Clostridium beijerinckii]
MLPDIEKDLQNSRGDVVYSTVKAGLSSIPLAGSAISEFFSLIVSQPVSKRRDEWLIRIKNALEELSEKVEGFDLSNLCNNEEFTTVLMNASQMAIRNHNEIKLEALKNAVLNSAIRTNLDDTIQFMYLNYISELTSWHIQILDLFRNPTNWFIKNNKNKPSYYSGAPAHMLEDAFNELKGKKEFYNLIIKDLYNKGLLNIESLHTMMTENGIFASRTTQFGNEFINYISSPII